MRGEERPSKERTIGEQDKVHGADDAKNKIRKLQKERKKEKKQKQKKNRSDDGKSTPSCKPHRL